MAHKGDPKLRLQEESAETQEEVAPSAVDGSYVASLLNRLDSKRKISLNPLNGESCNLIYMLVASTTSKDELKRALEELGLINPVAKRKHEGEEISSENTHTPSKLRVTSKATLATSQLSNSEKHSEKQSSACSQGDANQVNVEEQNSARSETSDDCFKTLSELMEFEQDLNWAEWSLKRNSQQTNFNDSLQSAGDECLTEDNVPNQNDLSEINEDSDEEQKTNEREESPRDNKTSTPRAPKPRRIPRYKIPKKLESGVLDYVNWNFPIIDIYSAPLGAMDLRKLSYLGGPNKRNVILCEPIYDSSKKYVIKSDVRSSEGFLRELESLRDIKHANVLQPLSFRCLKTISFRVQRYFPNGTLATHIGKMPAAFIAMHFIKIAHALYYLHDNQVFHLDLRPEKIMIDDNNNPMISDFSKADHFKPGKTLIDIRKKTKAELASARRYGAKVSKLYLICYDSSSSSSLL
ncbi:serine/threonine protein kinase [Elysia marginata]|uniref:Serine/threonine protein kinase n=1 Tax=Elysia marginata TaxID=1093978 RepID=A0AAV4GM92_9GAST|nr:serine/threonine protein kinase [Elysia marginata]